MNKIWQGWPEEDEVGNGAQMLKSIGSNSYVVHVVLLCISELIVGTRVTDKGASEI
jgi:hypothetical protein